METPEERRQRVHQEKQLSDRLQLATTRLEAAQQERLWAIAAAYEAGLSMRKIAATTGLSLSRVHQLLSDEESREVPQWLSQLGVCLEFAKKTTIRWEVSYSRYRHLKKKFNIQ